MNLFLLIHEYSKEFSLSVLVKLNFVSKAGYSMWNKSHSTPQANCDEEIYCLISGVFNESNRTYGIKQIKRALFHKYRCIFNHQCTKPINSLFINCILDRYYSKYTSLFLSSN